MNTTAIPLVTARLEGNICCTAMNGVQCKGRATWIAIGAAKEGPAEEYKGHVYYMWFCDEHEPNEPRRGRMTKHCPDCDAEEEVEDEGPIDQSRIHELNKERRNNSRGETSGPITPPACAVPIRFHPLGTHIGCHGEH